MLLLIVPALFTNTKKTQISAIDNKALTEWPVVTWRLENRNLIEDYINDRIGLREPAINTYIALNDKLFNSISSSTLVPQSTECRKCQQHITTTVRTGECPVLGTDHNFINLVSKYNEFRYNKKQKNQS